MSPEPVRGRIVGDYLRLGRQELPPAPGEDIPRMAAWCDDAGHLANAAGGVRAGALLAMVDTVAGFLSGLSVLPRWIVTTNILLSVAEPAAPAPIRLEAAVLRRGRSAVVAEVTVTDGEARPVAEALVTSSILDPPADMTLDFERPVRVEPEAGDGRPPFEVFFPAEPAGRNVVVMEVAERLRNPWNILHGGAVAALVDAAAIAAAGTTARPAVTTDVVLQYLRPVRVGPAEARTAVRRGPGGRRLVEVEVSDAGAGGRRTAWAMATTVPVPGRQ